MNHYQDLIAHNPLLAHNAKLMSEYMDKMKALTPLKKMALDYYEPLSKRKSYIETFNALEKEASAAMMVHSISPDWALKSNLDKLGAANTENKRTVLRTIPTIIVPVAAMYLGVPEVDLHRFKYSCKGLFGARYMGRHSYSMDELHLIAQNPEWMTEYTFAKPQTAAELPALTALDDFIFLDEEEACDFTDLSELGLREKVRRSYRNYSPYRLSDLEKIRIAKLNGQEQ